MTGRRPMLRKPRFSTTGERTGEWTNPGLAIERATESRTMPRRKVRPFGLARLRKLPSRRAGRTVRAVTWEKEPEAHFQARVIKAAHVFGFKLIYHTHDSRRSPAGFPDLVMVNEQTARLLFVELKASRGVVTRSQQRWLNGLGRIPYVECYVWRPAQWEELKGILRDGPQQYEKTARA